VEAQMTAFEPRSMAFERATVIPRSLNDPVGFTPSFLMKNFAAPTDAFAQSRRISQWRVPLAQRNDRVSVRLEEIQR